MLQVHSESIRGPCSSVLVLFRGQTKPVSVASSRRSFVCSFRVHLSPEVHRVGGIPDSMENNKVAQKSGFSDATMEDTMVPGDGQGEVR